jgi:hypothetical protein
MNDLDRAIFALQRSTAATPEFYRQIAQGDLWFLVRYHPEIEGEKIELKNAAPMPFIQFQVEQGAAVALFSSSARVDECMDKAKIPSHRYSTGSMPARQMLEILGKSELPAVVNQGCASGSVTIPPNLMRDLADGSALKPIVPKGTMHASLTILNPADYPTHLIQPLFELMRRHAQFRAGWVCAFPPAADQPARPPHYQFLILMDPRDERLFHDLNMTLAAAERDQAGPNSGLGLVDETDADYIAGLFRQVPAFFTAADYRRPPARGHKPPAGV